MPNILDKNDFASRDFEAKRIRGVAGLPKEPHLVVAHSPEGPVTPFDGMHRVAAWVAHLETDRDYPVVITVVITTDVAPKWQLPD